MQFYHFLVLLYIAESVHTHYQHIIVLVSRRRRGPGWIREPEPALLCPAPANINNSRLSPLTGLLLNHAVCRLIIISDCGVFLVPDGFVNVLNGFISSGGISINCSVVGSGFAAAAETVTISGGDGQSAELSSQQGSQV